MQRLTQLLVLLFTSAAVLLFGTSGTAAAVQLTPTPAAQLPTTPLPPTGPRASPAPLTAVAPARLTPMTTMTRGAVEATQTAAIATIAAADSTATAVARGPLTAVAATGTALALPTATLVPSSTPSPTRTATVAPSPTQTATPTAVPIPPSATADLLAITREVFITTPVTLDGEQLEAGTTLQIPRGVSLQNGAIPPGTPILTPSGAVVTLPSQTRIPAVDSPSTVSAPLNAVLSQSAAIDDTSYPPGTPLVLPSGTLALGALDLGASVLLRRGTIVQVGGQMLRLAEPVSVALSGTPLAQPAALPRTGDAEPLLWPTGLGLALVLLGWRLRRGT